MNQELRQMVASDAFAQHYLQLCVISYAQDPASIAAQVHSLDPLDAGGEWKCVWGPVQDAEEDNLVYVAAYYAASGVPVFAVSVIRGTDDPSIEGIIGDLWEDLDVAKQVPWPQASDDGAGEARIAAGTADGLAKITAQSFVHSGRTLLQFLHQFLAQPDNHEPLLAVTGHSLGGCLTTVLAPWLQVELGKAGVAVPIVPVTFAAPTAGNAAFMDLYQKRFPYCPRWYNTLDVVPKAYADLRSIHSIYKANGLACETACTIAIDAFIVLLDAEHASYSQQNAGNAALAGVFVGKKTWIEEAAYQHHVATYVALVGRPAKQPSSKAAPQPPDRAAEQ